MSEMGYKDKEVKGKRKVGGVILGVVVLAFVVCWIGIPLFVRHMRREENAEERYVQYLQRELAHAVCSMEYVEHAEVEIADDGQNCQVEISVEMRQGQTLPAEDEEAIRKMAESVLSGQYSGEIAVTFLPAG